MFKKYYQLTKPGIIQGNLMTAAAGFLLASPHKIDFGLLLATLAGTALVIAAGCVFNNYLDRQIDKKMARTKQRALVQQTIPVVNALIFGAMFGVIGFAVLIWKTNWLVVVIGLVGLIDYVVLYGYSKRHSVHGTLVGTIAGATPVMAGYCAASGRFDAAAVVAFLILATWQMAHFYGIAMYRHDDYLAAGLPVLPVVKGMRAAKIQSLCYIGAFVVATALLTVFGYTGFIYLAVMLILGFVWFWRSWRSFHTTDDKRWGRKMFLFSLIVLMVTSLMLAVGPRLP